MSSLGDTLGYLVFGNPLSQTLISTAASVTKSLSLPAKKLPANGSNAVVAPVVVRQLALWEIAGRDYSWIRLAGLSGATAVIMGAYGKHSLASILDTKDQMEAKAVFETANRYHFLHSFVLLTMPLVKKPALTGSLMAAGTILFSGTMYYRALTGDKTFVHVATCGGFCLIAAWLTLII